MRDISRQYEQLFEDFGRALFLEIETLTDPSEVMNRCTQRIDEALAAFESHFPDPSQTACKKGCHFCCFFPVDCPPQVCHDVASHMDKTFSRAMKAKLKKKLQEDSQLRKEPFNRAPCPFLSDNRRCMIYEKRPLACRWFTSTDPALCEASLTDGTHVPQHAVRQRLYQVATTMLLALEKQQGRDGKQVAFISSLLKLL